MAKTTKKKKSYYKPKGKTPKIDATLIDTIRKQVLDELKQETVREEAQSEKARTEAEAVREKFVKEMKASPEPWVDVLLWTETPTGVKYQLDWNDAFIKHLENNGIKGVDEDQTVQKWVALLLRSSADNMESHLTETLQDTATSEYQ